MAYTKYQTVEGQEAWSCNKCTYSTLIYDAIRDHLCDVGPENFPLPVGESMKIEERSIVDERAKQYGPPDINLSCAADLTNAYMRGRRNSANWDGLCAEDVAMILLLVKVARIATGPCHVPDNYRDIRGYCEIAESLADGLEDYKK
jgi:hypothetical protein